MPEVKIKDGEPFDVAMRRLKRACEKAGIPGKVREMEFHRKPTAIRKAQKAAARKRWEKKLCKDREGFRSPSTEHKKSKTYPNKARPSYSRPDFSVLNEDRRA